MRVQIDPRVLPRPADHDRMQRGFDDWLERAKGCEDDPALAAFMVEAAEASAPLRPLLEAVFGNSPFLTWCLLNEAAFLREMVTQGLDETYAALTLEMKLDLGGEADTTTLMRELRKGKRRVALLVAIADLTHAWPLMRVTEGLAHYAETALSLACRHLLRQGHEAGDIQLPHPEDPERGSGLIVLGMGKLGALELNYSSDIDIIVFYDQDKVAYTGRKSVGEFFTKLTRSLVRIMEERTAEGYVFRTDLRLRPDPGSTPPAVSLAAAEAYYEGFGQNWERAAMIKARPVAGDMESGEAFVKFLRPFIWRKHLDFAAINDIHSIKRQINAHKGGARIAVAGHNVKLGRGGIREVEFFAQTQQLIWGGRQPELRCSRTLDALEQLAALEHVVPETARQMADAYDYLRRLEHRLQMIDDKQTQTLPTDPRELGELAVFAGHADVEAFAASLTAVLRVVEDHYAALFEDSPSLTADTTGDLVFTGGENDPATLKTLAGMGFKNAEAICGQIRGWHHGRVRCTRSTRARELLTELTPALLAALARTSEPDAAFMKFDEFLTGLPAGVPLFSLFTQNPMLLDLVAEVMGNAPRLAAHLSRHTNLLDAVLTQNFFDSPPDLAALQAELDKALAEARDFQEVLDISRRWANDHKFQVGILTLKNLLDPDQAAHALSDVAEAVLSRLHPLVEEELARAHGRVPGAGSVIIAMGKAGSREMTATSDLDLVLVYDAPADSEGSDGPKPLSPSVYYARLTQRIVNALTAPTGEGTLYEVDMRLRPSGNAGPVASSFDSFRRYHEEAAWTWEHMAMTRARVVSGDAALKARVEGVIAATLSRPRDPDKLLWDVASMRERMAREHKSDSVWETKHYRGGLVDIEFIAQYLQLAHAAATPAILSHSTVDVLRRAADLGHLDNSDSETLIEALRLWWAIQSVLRQTVAGAFREDAAPEGLRRVLVKTAGAGDWETLRHRAATCAQAAYALFCKLIAEPAEPLRARFEQEKSA